MADLEDAYSDLGGRSYALPSGTSGLSSYGQRVYGRPVESVSSIDTDLQTERALLAVEQQKASAVRQLRDTALASMNLREKNRIEEQAGYVASKLTDIDPRADDFENQITTLYSQFPYGFRDQAINSAINFKRDIRKQYDLTNQNMQREESLQARAAQKAEEMQAKAQQEQEFREYQTFSKSLSPFYQSDFLAKEEEAKRGAKAEGREFGMEDRRELMASFTQRQAQEKVEQDLMNADLNPEDFRTESGFDYTKARKALFDFGKRDKQMSEARSIVATLRSSILKREERGEPVPQEELDLYNRAIGTMNRLSQPKAAAAPAAPAAVGEAATATPEVKTLSSKEPDFLGKARSFQVGEMVSVDGSKPRKWDTGDVERAKAAPEPKAEKKQIKLEGVPPVQATGKVIPATPSSKFVIALDNPYVKEAYPTGIDIQSTVTEYNKELRKSAQGAFNKQVMDAQKANQPDVVKKLVDDKERILLEYENSYPRTKAIMIAVADPLTRKMFKLNQDLTRTTDQQELANISNQLNELKKAKNRLDLEVYSAVQPSTPEAQVVL